ncbi:NAD(P)-dependent glycerol-3-phosphate dehydrogenase [Jannaschia sp. Os4]|nr:NAD(P)-dependent glycerol-3-phosphate dehydrogenase [Jannaschia sp. Os4]
MAVIGAGAFGAALSVAWAGAGRDVTLWGRDAAAMRAAQRTRRLPRLPDVDLPDRIRCVADLDEAADPASTGCTVLAVPMQALAPTLARLRIDPATAVAACKGLETGTLRGATAILAEALPRARVGILSGPSFAADVARGLPTALTLGMRDAADVQDLLSTPALRLYRTDDVVGVELGGALKNVTAIACGAAIGAGLGESARAALMTRGMAETARLAAALGADPRTLSGLSGLGDLALTCASPQSRNFAAGLALGRGAPPPDATTEGVHTVRAALDLAARHGVEMPVARATAALLDGTTTIGGAVDALLSRDLTTE